MRFKCEYAYSPYQNVHICECFEVDITKSEKHQARRRHFCCDELELASEGAFRFEGIAKYVKWCVYDVHVMDGHEIPSSGVVFCNG
jgi:hypothetical protein